MRIATSKYLRVPAALILLTLPLFSRWSAPPARADEPTSTSLLANGDMETDKDKDNWPDGWPKQNGVSWEAEAGNHFLRLKQTEPNAMQMLYQPIALRPEHREIELRLRLRYTDVKPGKEKWNDARFIFHFKNANKEAINPDPPPLYFLGSSNGWIERDVRFTVPPGATLLEIIPSLFGVASGTLDIDDLRIIPVAAQIPTAPLADATEQTDLKPLPELKVVGNQIKSADGKVVWLQGVNVPSLDWMPEGDHALQSVKEAAGNWKSNVIRLPVNDDYWFGRHERQKDGGVEYRALVDSCIRAAASRGAYIVLDLHKYRAISAAQLDFWKAASAVYKSNSAVIFDIINEPHDISWAQWKNGGTIEDKPAKDGRPAEIIDSPGMQKVIDAIRAGGARNIIVAGGLDWAYDLSGVLQNWALSDRGGNGIVYSSHIYPWKKDWQNKVLAVAAKHPILLGEVGVDPRPVGDNPNESGYTWAPDMMGTIQKHKLHWTAWSFHTDATPRVLQDWNYNPTPFWGAWVRAALLGAKFETNRLR